MPSYTAQEKFDLLKRFHDMDANGDGDLSIDEIKEVLKHSKLPPSKATEFLDLFDADGDGRVTLDEYERALGLQELPVTSIDDWKKTFAEMDTDNSGYLTVREIYEGLKRAGMAFSMEDIREIVNSVDENGDQKLSLNEFTALMRMNS